LMMFKRNLKRVDLRSRED